MKPVKIFLTVLVMVILSLSFQLLAKKLKLPNKQTEKLFKKQQPFKCEKPCCHVFFNKYCEYCRAYRDK